MRPIDADVVIKHIEEYWEMVKRGKPSRGMTTVMQNIKTIVNSLPTIDAEPVCHGKWIKIHPQGIYECSECHQNVMTSDIDCYKFCHQCGARMKEE